MLDAFQGLRRCGVFVQAVRQSAPLSLQDFTDDLEHRLRGVWRDVEGVGLQGSTNKLATYHALFAVPFDTTARASAFLPRHLSLELAQRVLRLLLHIARGHSDALKARRGGSKRTRAQKRQKD